MPALTGQRGFASDTPLQPPHTHLITTITTDHGDMATTLRSKDITTYIVHRYYHLAV